MKKTPPSRRQSAVITVVLSLLAMFPPLATDMYLSAMGDVAVSLNAAQSSIELSLSLFFLGLCVGQLLVGPMIDAFGRKLPLLAGTALFTVTSIGLLLVSDVAIFNGLRFLQAVGACAGMVTGRAIVSDLYDDRQGAKVLTVLVMLMTIGPIIAPSLGSLLLSAFGWQSIFVALVGVGLLSLVLISTLIPETLPTEARQRGALKSAVGRFGSLLSRRSYILPTVVAALIQSAMFAFITASSGVFQGAYGLSSTQYGLLFGLIASALIIFGRVNHVLLNRFEPAQIISAGLPIFAAAAVLLLTVSGSRQMWVVVVPLWLTIGLVGLLSANTMSVAMRGTSEGAGIGSAALGAVQFGVAFAISSIVALVGTDSATPMAAAMVCSALLALAIWAYGVKSRSLASTALSATRAL